VILLSHRGPVSFDRDPSSAERSASRGAGGLVTALTGLAGHLDDAVWVCVAGGRRTSPSPTRRTGGRSGSPLDGDARVLADDEPAAREVCVRLLRHPREVHEPFYGVISNPLLWFVQHRLHDLKTSPAIGRDERAAFDDGYAVANELAAAAVVEQVEAAGGRRSSCCTTTTSTSSGTWSGSAAPAR
jgi:trehalose 6-phosphate synthase